MIEQIEHSRTIAAKLRAKLASTKDKTRIREIRQEIKDLEKGGMIRARFQCTCIEPKFERLAEMGIQIIHHEIEMVGYHSSFFRDEFSNKNCKRPAFSRQVEMSTDTGKVKVWLYPKETYCGNCRRAFSYAWTDEHLIIEFEEQAIKQIA